MPTRAVVHVDMDAFFASVEELDHPGLRGRPVLVGGRADARGVVAAANYAARRFGIHSAMPMRTALRQCPDAIVLPPRPERYREVSARIHAILARFTPVIEPVSLDEAYLDVTASTALLGSPEDMGRHIKRDIRAETGLVASVGVGPNKLVAKIASDMDKPDGFVVAPANLAAFLDPLPLARLPGLGQAAQRTLHRLNIRSVRDVRLAPNALLEQALGAHAARRIRALARGEDHRPVAPSRMVKSISHEQTFPADTADEHILRASLLNATEQVAHRLRQHERLAAVVAIKLRHADFSTLSRQARLPAPTDTTDALWRVARRLFRRHWDGQPLRLIGAGVTGLTPAAARQPELFATSRRSCRLDAASDAVRERFGANALRRAAALQQRHQG